MQVLLAAAKLMRTQGYASTTLRQIADEVGIKAGSIYYHFSSKEEILDAVLDLGITTVREAVMRDVVALGPDAGAREKLMTAIRTHLRALFDYGDFASVNMRIYGLLPEDIRLRNMRRREAYAEYWDELFKEATDEGLVPRDINPRVARLILIGALNWTVEWFDPKRGPIEAIAHTFDTMLFGGLLSAAPRSNRKHSSSP
jgi:AcrR family transcriptional regulator